MRVAFDVTSAVSGDTGIAVYATELPAALERLGVAVTRFSVGRRVRDVPLGARHLPVPLRVLHPAWRTVGVPRAEHLVGDVDLVHAAGPIPIPSRRPVIAVVHDLSALDHPELHSRRARTAARRTLQRLPGTARVVTVSNATAAALERHGVDPSRITVTPNGLRSLPTPDHRLVPEGPYVLCVGQLAARKRLDVVLRAVSMLPRSVGIVICGPDAGMGESLRDLSHELGLGDRILFTGRASDAELAGLYNSAIVLTMASADEGFGLPVLEAMAAGLPIVATEVPALRELAGDGARYVPVGDAAALAHALAELVSDSRRRDAMGKIGRDRASTRTWEACARSTLAVYQSVVA